VRPHPPEAPQDVRAAILQALKSDEFTIHKDAYRFLETMQFVSEDIISIDLVEYLEAGHRLYLLSGPTIKDTKYQCCLGYEGGLDLYFKLTPCEWSESYHILIGCHRHNTGYPPLPE
jgi:hypothetical protein